MSPTRKEFAEALFRASETLRALGVLALSSRDIVEWVAALTLTKHTMRNLVGLIKQVDNVANLPTEPTKGGHDE